MKQKFRNGVVVEKYDGQEKLLTLLYGSAAGRALLKPLTAPVVSRLGGWFLSTGVSRVLIKPFIRANGIDMTQFEPVSYRSYNELFSRRIRPEARPVDMDPKHLISPLRQQADGAADWGRHGLYPEAYSLYCFILAEE